MNISHLIALDCGVHRLLGAEIVVPVDNVDGDDDDDCDADDESGHKVGVEADTGAEDG